MTDSHEQLSNLSPDRRTLLLSRLKKQKEQAAKKEKKAITRQSRDTNEFPLSFAQQGIWFLEQFEKDSVEYNFALAFSLIGQLHVSAFEKSINDIVRRHETLRTTFKEIDGQPIQVISPAQTIPLNKIDLTHLPKDEQTEKIKQLAEEEAVSPLDLIKGPLIRVSLLQLEDEDHVFFLSIHHIVFDGWSRAVFNSELSALYEANVNGTAAELPDLPIQYADYSFWQNQLLIKDQLTGQLDYWKNRLAGAPPDVSFPTDKARARSLKAVVNAETFSIDPDLGDKLKQLCRQSNTTLFMAVFAAFSLLLSRYSGSQDVVIGLPMVDRSHRETEDLIGLFLNTIALRIDFTAQPSFHQLLHQVKQVSREALDNQDIPFQKLVEELHPERNLLYSPIFQVMFNLQSDPKEGIELTGLEVTPLKFRNSLPGTNYDLMFSFTDGEDGVRGVAEYNTDLYDPTTISRMICNLQVLLKGCIENPEASVNAIPILSDEEEHQTLTLWNQTGTDYPLDATLQQLFETQVDITPEATALEFGEQALSYFELDERANRVAHYLRENGIGPGKLVGVYMERSLEMVVTLCGILKSGGAYVPMDPEYPADRIAFMVDETQVPVLLSQEHLRKRLPPTNSKVVCVDTDWEVIASNSGSRIADTSTAADLAYVIYTSGSTGKPKGVMNCHSGIVNHLFWMKENYPLQEDDRILQKTPYSFDVSVWEIFWPLVSGARLVMAQPGGHKDPMYLAKVIEDKRITTMHFVASMLKSYLEHAPLSAARSLKRVITSGEALSYELQEQFFKASSAQLVNLYGPTEAAVHVTRWECQHGDSRLAMPIGRPIANTRMYILDPHMRPVPVGVPGELHIGGIQVAQGYLNRPDLTAEKFIADPFSDDAKARLYKTGDQARYRADGNIEYIGRIDYQVKLRGFRIELGEIESVLADHEVVQDAVVVIREDEPGDKKLVAYMVAEAGDPVAPSVKDLRSFLRAKLPDFMMPAALVLLDRLPLTANGKLDRKTLPRPEAGDQATSVYVAPRTPTEEVLAGIWAQVLGVERVGIHDDFFELGGHSLLAIRLIEQMRRAGLGVEVRTLFGAPTIEALATVAGGDDTVAVPPNGIPAVCEAITPGMLPLVALTAEQIERVVASVPGGASNVQDIYPLAPLQEGILFHHLMAGEGDPYLLRWLKGFDSRSRLDAYIEALGAVIDRHDILRTAVVWEGLTEPVQVVWREAALVVEEVNLDAGAGDVAAQLWARIDPRAYRLDVSEAPLLRVFVAEDAAKGRWVMLQLAHHLAIDHTTVDVMQEEIQAHLLGEADQLPAPLPFRNFVAQARLGVSREEHEAFFSELLGDVEEPTAPFGLVDVQGDGSGITKANHPIEASLAKRLWARARALGVSAATLCHLAYAQVLARTSGRDDVVFGTVLFGRMQGGVGADEALGMFINTLPVRIRLGDATVEASVRETHTQLAQLLRHEHASLALAQRASAVMAPIPLFSALMNYRHIAGAGEPSAETRRAWEGVESLGVEERTNYPLVLSVNDLGRESLSLTAQARQPLDPERICAYMDTALEALVEALERTPVAPVHSLEVLGAGEREQLLLGWNATAVEYPRGESLKGLFEAQVERDADAVAVVFEDESLSYGELNARTNQLAHYLRERGVGPEVMVGICVERSLELVVGILGIVKAGGAYVPLDPDYPQSRIKFMLEDARVSVLLTTSDLEKQLPAFDGERVCLDSGWPRISRESADNPATSATADNLAYVIYTSGSTGTPKGVMVTHNNVTRLFAATELWYGFTERDVWTLFHSSAFDFSVWEIWGALLYGGRLVVVPFATSRSPDLFYDLLVEAGVTVLNQTPSAFKQLMQVDESRAMESLNNLRFVIFGGEGLNPQSLAPWFEKHGDVQPKLINMYGITETTVHVTYRPLTSSVVERSASVIGRSIPDLQIYILDQYLQPAPIGVPGEMYVGGAGLARGYLNRPELTAERFIAHPFSDQADARLYRTGDLARYLSDGDIEYLGRTDHQVKLRGFRIELGEIETVLGQQASVRDALAIISEDGTGDKRLVAYVVPTLEWMEQNPQARDAVLADPMAGEHSHHELVPRLRQHIRGQLPAYMVPSVFIVLDEFPLNANGKLDRQALPGPGDIRSSLEARYTAPRNEIEERLAGIWTDILQHETVGIHDNFFDLGGHSLKMTQVVSRLRQHLNIELPLSQMFSYPTVAELAPVVGSLLDENSGDEADVIPIVDRAGDLPLSFAQERLWFLDRLEPGSTAYNIPLALRLKGELSVAALENSLQAIVGRQEGLRTHFTTQQGKPFQIIEDVTIELKQDDLSALTSAMLEDEVKSRIDAEAIQPFDTNTGPLLRCRLLRLSDHEHVLLLTMHHIISDGWSLGVLFRELGACYEAFSQGEQPALAELPIQYADFAVWQREWLSGEMLASQMAYWQEKLEDLSTLNLPTDRRRPVVQTYTGSSEKIRLDAELSNQLTSLSRQAGVTLFMTLLGGFAVLMHRYSGQDDVVIGSPIANRNRSELEDLIGFFINLLVMRTDVSGNPGFRELLGQVQETALGAYQHQDIPFEKLVEVLQPTRDRSRNPLFQVQFALQNAPMEPLELQGLTLEPVSRQVHTTRFDLECHVLPRGAELDVLFVYNTDLFDAGSIRRMLEHYRNLLQSVVAEPDRRIAELAILSAEEQQQFVDWNQTATDYPRDKTVYELFEYQAVANPDAVAVEYAGKTLSYRQLNERANCLAHYLHHQGVGPEVMVGLYLERGLEMVVGLLGILKAGGAYVPLDLDYPQSRITFMLEDARVPVLLSMSSLSEQLPDFTGELVCLDSDWTKIDNESADNPAPSTAADNLAYVIYTSGSTGTPKGVMVTHNNVTRLFAATEQWYGFTERDVWTLFHSSAFDFSVWEIWGALLYGGRLVVVPFETSRSPDLFYDLLVEAGVTVLNQTPSAFKQLMEVDESRALESLGALRLVIFGGEALNSQSLGPWFEKHGDAQPRLVNMYGITETTVHVTYRPLTSSVVERGASVIGRAIPDLQIYILDRQRQPVPIGVPGEMYIGGAGLARGYLNRPELTAERFIAHPFSGHPGARLYRTGDLARYLADGDIEYLGRTDYQVKLRGFRIELGEIETVLAQQASVRDALAIISEDKTGDKRLVAYVVPTLKWMEQNLQARDAVLADPLAGEQSHHELVPGLRQRIREQLPAYMVPSVFIVLNEFPLNANGKLDQQALPGPGDIRSSLEAQYTAPRNEIEERLACIWADILQHETVGIHDNFFDLGGHSLKMTQVVSRIRAQLNVELPLSEMFSCPTLAELAPAIESLLDESGEEQADVIPVAGREGNLPLSFAQERLWFLDQLEPGGSAYNMPLALRLKGELSVAALQDSINAIVDRQEGLRTHFTMHQGKPFQIIGDVTIELKQDDLSTLPPESLEDEVKTRIDTEASQPFDLNRGPLLRCRLLRLSDHEHVLLLTMHHVISDGWSLGVLFRELGACYEAFSQGEQPALAELPIQYADFAVWQREWLSGEVLASQMAYWREKLGGLSTLNLPTDRPRPVVQTYTGAMEKISLDVGLSKQLTSLSRQAGVTLFMTLLAGFAILMHRYSGQEDIVVGTPIANRNRSELEDLIGFFVNSLVMRTDVSGNPGFRELVQRVNRTAVDAYEHQDLPFEKLVDEIQPQRDLSHNPLFQVMFALQNAPIESLELKGLTLESVSREVKVSGFDLECHVWEKGDRLEVIFVYNTDLFDTSTIRRMMTHYRRLLEASVASPETPVAQLEILDDEEKQLMLRQWNQTRVDFVQNETLHSLFDQQVQRTPQAMAVRFEQHSLDYSELGQKANDIACLLIAKNVEPGQFVGVYIERSIDLIVAILGVLKAGAAYIPLDPEYPLERLSHMVADANIRVLLSQEKFGNCVPSGVTDVICLDSSQLYEAVKPQVLPVVTENMSAYVIYTSGSTGKPKGVMVSHRAVVNHACWMQNLVKYDQTDRVLLKAPISFDASVGEIFDPLLIGACVVVAVPGGHSDSEYLIQTVRKDKVTSLILTPSQLRMLLLSLTDPAALSTLKHIGCGGEALSPDLLQAYYEKCTAPLYNLYGPTESTIDATSFLCEANFDRDNIPIGYPVSNTSVYILDQQLQPVPIGVHGELHIGGAGLAQGYLNQPELTTEKFIADPFSDDPEARLYKTGDLVRYRADGSVEFIGRIDHQVKVRGSRIELGEIETVLAQHEHIKDCAVLIYEDLQGNNNIAAYFVSDISFSTLSLRNFLRKKLPQYMIPTLLTNLDEIPVTPNGKTDYKTLAAYTKGKTISDSSYLSPETPVEKKIASIWETLLNVDRVGVGDNFFDIGGHSLLLIQAKFVIEKEVGVSVPVVDFFHQTLGQIATYCEKNKPREMSMEEV